jgi:His/Glu/Gln/Arg/opine family amino acid ABC transporter permease subunit
MMAREGTRELPKWAESLLEFEESMAGKPSARWAKTNGLELTGLAILLSATLALFGSGPFPIGLFEMASIAMEGGVVNGRNLPQAGAFNSFLYATISALFLFLAYWVTLTTLIKWTPGKGLGPALLGVATSWIALIAIRYVSHFVLVEADWEVMWANRVLALAGPEMTSQMTQSQGSVVECINTCYGINQNFRLWWILYVSFAVVGAAYGTSGDSPLKFTVTFLFLSMAFIFIAYNQTSINYHWEGPVRRLVTATLLAYISFGATYYYCLTNEEYKANRLKSRIAIAGVLTFFFALVIMNPPETVKDIAKFLGGQPAQDRLSDVVAGTYVPSTLDKLAGDGIQASQWGGLFVNLIIATAGGVLGFGVGVVLAFGRQSDQPFFSVPSVAIIELVRSGPLICWLYFAVFMMPDLMDPFFNAEDIVRMLLMFGIFGGCYIAEVLRGGLQAVDSGQKEAAIALGLSPIQTKLQVELPNAVRTTLPSIVSVFIGLWKDTTLLFIVNILDFFKLSKDMPNTDLRFLGSFLEPVWVSALVFWVFAFYLSRISMRIEKNLGLVREGGGEAA